MEPTIELPIVCSKCLGDESSLTMLRDVRGIQCKLCTRPFPSFTWRKQVALTEKTRFCISCADRNNCCQSCYRNFATGLSFAIHSAGSNLTSATPELLKYAAMQAEDAKAVVTTQHEYRSRLESQQQQPQISGPAQFIYSILTANKATGGAFLVAGLDPKLDLGRVRSVLSKLGAITSFSGFPEARCGFVAFEDNAQALRSAPRGVLLVDGHKLRLVACESGLEIVNSQREISLMIEKFMRGSL